MGQCDIPGDRQPKPAAAPGGAGKRLEQSLPGVVIKPRAVIRDIEDRQLAGTPDRDFHLISTHRPGIAQQVMQQPKERRLINDKMIRA